MLLLARGFLVATRAGLILQAFRDDPNRARYLGFDVAAYQVFFFTVSAAFAGLAGMLYVITAEFASPTFMDPAFSISMVVWAAVGGRNSLLGACIGAILINTIEATASETEMLQGVVEGDHRPDFRAGRPLPAAGAGRADPRSRRLAADRQGEASGGRERRPPSRAIPTPPQPAE